MKIRFPLLPRWMRWAVTVVIAAFIFYASIVTVPPETAIDEARFKLLPLDKWRHFVAYAVLGGAVAYGLEGFDIDSRYLALTVLAVTIAYGIGIELGQSLSPQRYFSLGDAYANTLGAVISLCWYAVRPYLHLMPVGAMISGEAGFDE
jgi:VanZ family protein